MSVDFPGSCRRAKRMCEAPFRASPPTGNCQDDTLLTASRHGRRKVVEVVENFPEECRYVLEQLREVYKNDVLAREQGMSPEQRLHFHQVESGPRMKDLETWFKEQFAERKVEPNSGLGEAILYMQKYWDKLTLFLRQAGAPLDNNIVEQNSEDGYSPSEERAVLQDPERRPVGDLFMSLIHTCQLCGANPFDYLTELQRHRRELFQTPSEWMPWNYRGTLARS